MKMDIMELNLMNSLAVLAMKSFMLITIPKYLQAMETTNYLEVHLTQIPLPITYYVEKVVTIS